MAVSITRFLTGFRLVRGEDLNQNFSGLPQVYRTSASLTKNTSAAYSAISGLSFPLTQGTYAFDCYLPSTVASGTAGIKYSFSYSNGLTLSAMQASGEGETASAVAVQNTTSTTSSADLFTQAAVVIQTRITGTMVVSAAGTLTVQMAQNTSNGSDTIALLGGFMSVTRIS